MLHFTLTIQKRQSNLRPVFKLFFAFTGLEYYGEVNYTSNLYYEGRTCDSLTFLNQHRQYQNDKEYMANILEKHNYYIFQVIDMYPGFRLRMKLDKLTDKVMYEGDIQSVFDICWHTYFPEWWQTSCCR